jgi:hypothetical protein
MLGDQSIRARHSKLVGGSIGKRGGHHLSITITITITIACDFDLDAVSSP